MAAQLSAPGRAKRASARKAPRVKCQCQRARLSCRQSVRTQYDAETGFYFLRTRYYDPTVGRFVQEDKIGRAGGLNLYAYAAGRPLAARDPMGTMADYYLLGELLWTPPSHNCWSQLACNRDGIDGRDLGGGRTAWDGFSVLTYVERDVLYAEYQKNFATQRAKGRFDVGCPPFTCGFATRALDPDEFSIIYSGLLILQSRVSTQGQYAATWALTYLRSGLFAVNPIKTSGKIFVANVGARIVWVSPDIDDPWFPGMSSPTERAYRLAHEAGHFYYNHLADSNGNQCQADQFADLATGYPEFGFYCRR
jgi:RHS repeat-associated protein